MSSSTTDVWFPNTLQNLLDRQELTTDQMRALMESFISGQCGEAEMAALLIALRMKGETAHELATAAQVLREHAVRLETEQTNVLDTCGTGGDGLSTFNVSTAVAFVVAGAGVPVVKHGNRAISSRSGSADVLTTLGVNLREGTDWPRECLTTAGLAFCMAPYFHPALKHVGAVRKKLATRTIFNCLGPLLNPALAPYQLLGVGRREWLDTMAGALAQLGTQRAFLVCGQDGLDEVTLTTTTDVREVHEGEIISHQWTPDDFGLPICDLNDLRVDDSVQSAEVIRSILQGSSSPAMNVVLANSSVALLVVNKVSDLRQGVELARESVFSGRAHQVLEALVGS